MKDVGMADKGAIGVVTKVNVKYKGSDAVDVNWINGCFKGREYMQLYNNLEIIDDTTNGMERAFLYMI